MEHMIDYEHKRIYIDYSTLATFRSCKEKVRLGNINAWQPRTTATSLSFGHAIHAGWTALYDAKAGWWREGNNWIKLEGNIDPVKYAQAAFLKDLGHTGNAIPISIIGEERRSLERGLGIIEAYAWRWRNELYENILDANEKPLVEVPFAFPFTTFNGFDVWYCGRIDRIMRSIMTKRQVIVEGKTTTQSLSMYRQQCKPNHQITGYFKGAQSLFDNDDSYEAIWDMVFVSSRAPNYKKSLTDRFFGWGIDIENDFDRQPTSRSKTDISEFMLDLEADAIDYCTWATSNIARWPRNAPQACHNYSGCMFRLRCNMNLTPEQEISFMSGDFVVKRWEPWKEIVDEHGNVRKFVRKDIPNV